MSNMNALLPLATHCNDICLFERIVHHLPALHQDDFYLAQVKADKAFLVVGKAASKIRSHKAIPISIEILVKFFFYIPCNILKKRQCNNFRKLIINQPTNKPTKHITSLY
jgi:hypothetical protein